MKWIATEWAWFSAFFEKVLVSRVKRRIDMRIVRFCRSTKDVEMSRGSGLPLQQNVFVPWICAGL